MIGSFIEMSICQLCQLRLDGHPSKNGKIHLFGKLVKTALSKDLKFFSTIRTDYVAVVLYNSKYLFFG